jgi:hypothetical protein
MASSPLVTRSRQNRSLRRRRASRWRRPAKTPSRTARSKGGGGLRTQPVVFGERLREYLRRRPQQLFAGVCTQSACNLRGHADLPYGLPGCLTEPTFWPGTLGAIDTDTPSRLLAVANTTTSARGLFYDMRSTASVSAIPPAYFSNQLTVTPTGLQIPVTASQAATQVNVRVNLYNGAQGVNGTVLGERTVTALILLVS